jgi:hypothetical protein
MSYERIENEKETFQNHEIVRVYSNYVDAANYERLSILFDGYKFVIDSEAAGTGIEREVLVRKQQDN